jgi:hypothetical protein
LLTSGRRWSRGRLGGEVYEGRVDVHAGGRLPRLLLLVPSWFTSFPLRRGAAPPGRGDGVPVVKWSLLQSGSRLLPCPAQRGGGAPASSLNPEQTGGGGRGNPKWGWVAWRPSHAGLLLLNRSREQLEEEKPSMPLAVRRAGQVALEAAAWGASDARWKGSGVFSLSPRSNPTPRARAGPRRARRLGGLAAPRPACWCGETGGARPARLTSAGVKRRGKRGREVRDAVTAKRAPPDSASGWVSRGGFWWAAIGAGPAGLGGLQRVF